MSVLERSACIKEMSLLERAACSNLRGVCIRERFLY